MSYHQILANMPPYSEFSNTVKFKERIWFEPKHLLFVFSRYWSSIMNPDHLLTCSPDTAVTRHPLFTVHSLTSWSLSLLCDWRDIYRTLTNLTFPQIKTDEWVVEKNNLILLIHLPRESYYRRATRGANISLFPSEIFNGWSGRHKTRVTEAGVSAARVVYS